MFRIIFSTLAAVALLGVTSAAAVAQQDLRMPDTRDAALAATARQDLRSPDAQDAARADEIASAMQRYEASVKPPAQAPASAPAPSDDTPWTVLAGTLAAAFALGAGAAAGLMYLRQPRGDTLARS